MKAKIAGLAAAGLLVMFGTSACLDKQTEPYQDAPLSNQRNTAPATVIEMPDGFSNVATKCAAPGIRIFVAFKGDNNRASVTAVQDPKC